MTILPTVLLLTTSAFAQQIAFYMRLNDATNGGKIWNLTSD